MLGRPTLSVFSSEISYSVIVDQTLLNFKNSALDFYFSTSIGIRTSTATYKDNSFFKATQIAFIKATNDASKVYLPSLLVKRCKH